MKTMNKHVKCPKCSGSGVVTLAKHLADTVALVTTKGVAASDLADALGVNRTAMHQRLAYLVRVGLVEREKYGKTVTFKLKKTK